VPRVTVLLTCYNHLPYLPAAWESLQTQTFRDFEIVAVDDGSTDGTREWLQKRASLERKLPDSRVVLLFNESNLGTYGSLNRALREAQGDFVAVFNDDDFWAPQKLERQLALFEAHPELGLVHTDGSFTMEGSPLGFEFPRTETGNVLIPLLYANKIIASAALIRRECFEALGGFDERYFGSGDWQMWLRIAEKWPVGYVDEQLTFYRVHGANASHKLERIWRDDEMLRKWIRSKYADYEALGLNVEELRRAKAHNEACLGTVLYLNGKALEAREAYRRSLELEPGRFKSRLRLWATYALPRPIWRKVL
jgi:glycosyltransferase involved in cell wall biosynthesis